MIKLLGFLGVMMVSGVVYAENVDMRALAMVESSGNPKAVGDSGKALGAYQLHQGAVKDVNRVLGTRYSHKDALGAKAEVMADTYVNKVIPGYLRHYKLKDTVENRLTAYNMGIGAVRKGVQARVYIKRYMEAL